MRLLKLTALAGMSLLLVALFIGCGSDDDSTPTTPSITYGDNNDPDFVPVQDEINDLLVEIVDDMFDGFDNMYVTPGDTTSARADLMPSWIEPDPEVGPDTLIAIYQNGWYSVYASYTGDIYRSRLWDSVQFQLNGDPREDPSGSDYIHFIDNWEITALNQDITHADFEGRNDYEIFGLDVSVATVNGTTDHYVEAVYIGADTSMTYTYDFSSTATTIRVPKFVTGWASACPISGTIDMTLTQTFEWTGAASQGEGSSTWTIEVVFDYGTASVTANNGTTTWVYTCEVCDVPGTTL